MMFSRKKSIFNGNAGWALSGITCWIAALLSPTIVITPISRSDGYVDVLSEIFYLMFLMFFWSLIIAIGIWLYRHYKKTPVALMVYWKKISFYVGSAVLVIDGLAYISIQAVQKLESF